MPVLIQVNAAGEASKGGWDISDHDNWAKISDELEGVFALPNIRIDGLMTMPPLTDRAETNRFFFRNVRRFLEFLRMRFRDAPLTQLSMGTSQDFAVAVEEGATMVRLGAALLGARNYQLKEGL